MVKDQMLSPKTWNKTRMSALTTPIQYCTGDSSQAIRQEKKNKAFKLERKRGKTIPMHR